MNSSWTVKHLSKFCCVCKLCIRWQTWPRSSLPHRHKCGHLSQNCRTIKFTNWGVHNEISWEKHTKFSVSYTPYTHTARWQLHNCIFLVPLHFDCGLSHLRSGDIMVQFKKLQILQYLEIQIFWLGWTMHRCLFEVCTERKSSDRQQPISQLGWGRWLKLRSYMLFSLS